MRRCQRANTCKNKKVTENFPPPPASVLVLGISSPDICYFPHPFSGQQHQNAPLSVISPLHKCFRIHLHVDWATIFSILCWKSFILRGLNISYYKILFLNFQVLKQPPSLNTSRRPKRCEGWRSRNRRPKALAVPPKSLKVLRRRRKEERNEKLSHPSFNQWNVTALYVNLILRSC